MIQIELCICTSGKPYAQCCEPLLEGARAAKTPQQLMRSRFSAFALSGYGDYLLETWLPRTSTGLDAAELSHNTINWQSLEIVKKSQKGDTGIVEFKAYYLDESAKQQMHHEVSQFQRLSGKWLYVDGEVKC